MAQAINKGSTEHDLHLTLNKPAESQKPVKPVEVKTEVKTETKNTK